ncbi:MAG: HAD family phosphatase [Candidatus Nealsonbacteria bacterium]|nr:HAD family phosphatase [Candidatus Nealsonbacteria bacterium]
MPAEFLYFDLGNVLLTFTVDRAVRQLAEVAQIDRALVIDAIYESGLQRRYEAGDVSSREFYEEFCQQTDTRPDYDRLLLAGSNIFEINAGMIPVVSQLCQAGYRIGILSNTCEAHWEYCVRRFRMLEELFSVHALSYRLRTQKPDASIFAAAAELANVAPEEIFFVDDTPGHVAGAVAAGFDAVTFTSTPEFVVELRKRDLQFNY